MPAPCALVSKGATTRSHRPVATTTPHRARGRPKPVRGSARPRAWAHSLTGTPPHTRSAQPAVAGRTALGIWPRSTASQDDRNGRFHGHGIVLRVFQPLLVVSALLPSVHFQTAWADLEVVGGNLGALGVLPFWCRRLGRWAYNLLRAYNLLNVWLGAVGEHSTDGRDRQANRSQGPSRTQPRECPTDPEHQHGIHTEGKGVR